MRYRAEKLPASPDAPDELRSPPRGHTPPPPPPPRGACAWFPAGAPPQTQARAAAAAAARANSRSEPLFHLPACVRRLMSQEAGARSGLERRRVASHAALLVFAHGAAAAELLRLHRASLATTLLLPLAALSRLRLLVQETAARTALALRCTEEDPDTCHEEEVAAAAAAAAAAKAAAAKAARPVPVALQEEEAVAMLHTVAKTSTHVCAEKGAAEAALMALEAKEGDGAGGGDRVAEMAAVGRWVLQAARAKGGDVLDEMAANFASPSAEEGHNLHVLCLAARHFGEAKAQRYPGVSAVSLLVLHVYTLAGPDVDALLGFADVPDYDTDKPAWQAYCADKTPSRNTSLFSTINWALRVAPGALPAPVPPPSGVRGAPAPGTPWHTLHRWAHYIVLLTALASARSGLGPRGLARGLAGLPAVVLRSHASLGRGSLVAWPAASSCAMDAAVSVGYINGDAANATASDGADKSGRILFLLSGMPHGVALQDISKYPNEREMLVPPFTVLCVDEAGTGGGGGHAGLPPGTLVVRASCRETLGTTSLRGCAAALKAAVAASQRAQRVLSKLRHLRAVSARLSTLRQHTGSSYAHAVRRYGAEPLVDPPQTPQGGRRRKGAAASPPLFLRSSAGFGLEEAAAVVVGGGGGEGLPRSPAGRVRRGASPSMSPSPSPSLGQATASWARRLDDTRDCHERYLRHAG